MTHAEKRKGYREVTEKLRRLADQSLLPDTRGDLLDVAVRFERMATCFEAQQGCRSRSTRGSGSSW
jgi:hypothetical protein